MWIKGVEIEEEFWYTLDIDNQLSYLVFCNLIITKNGCLVNEKEA